MTIKKIILIIAGLMFGAGACFSQASVLGNNIGGFSNILGYQSNITWDLNVKHEGNFPIIFSTNNIERMRIHENGNVGIGTAPIIDARVSVFQQNQIFCTNVTDLNTGDNHMGAYFTVNGAANDIGLAGYSVGQGDVLASTNVGVWARAYYANCNVGLYAQACPVGSTVAGYFNGDVMVTGSLLGPSDASLKNSIVPLIDMTSLLMELPARRYYYNQDVAGINLPENLQYGVIAQELQEVMPHLVHNVSSPNRFDEEGQQLSESQDNLTVDYIQIIPTLVAGFQEQDEKITSNAEEIEALTIRLAALMDQNTSNSERSINESDVVPNFEIDQNYPNPFTDETTISFSLELDAMLVLEIRNENNKLITTLVNDRVEAGTHNIVWNARSNPKGIYYCTIRIADKTLVKKMIKR